ncbi:Alfin [Parasponia andersonii]|uniref:PHD finger protein ALFIN-LIKE n=1 Tax=Parasponia andersonii TaxID=3476 RepID=A0A2P5C1D8_PARAD|nr:Alfin [Parasponia andersonii]
MEGGGGRLSLVNEAFKNFKGCRNGIIIALTTYSEEFYRQCDPEKKSLCLLGLWSGDWQGSPPGDVPSKLPEPTEGITYQDMGQQKRAGCAQLPRTSATVYEVVKEAAEKQPMLKPSTVSNHRTNKPKSRRSKDQELDDDEINEIDGDNLCGISLKKDASYRFWICCDVSDKWFHGKCVGITKASAKHIDKYMCPLCKRSKRAPP